MKVKKRKLFCIEKKNENEKQKNCTLSFSSLFSFSLSLSLSLFYPPQSISLISSSRTPAASPAAWPKA